MERSSGGGHGGGLGRWGFDEMEVKGEFGIGQGVVEDWAAPTRTIVRGVDAKVR